MNRYGKNDFYKKYYYLKPDCEKTKWEKVKDKAQKVGEWCQAHWKAIVTIAVVVVFIAVLGALAFAASSAVAAAIAATATATTAGTAGAGITALSTILTGAFMGAVGGAVSGAVISAVFARVGVAGKAIGKGLGFWLAPNCATNALAFKLFDGFKSIGKVTGVISAGLAKFDSICMWANFFNPDSKLYELNQMLHSNAFYNGFQIATSLAAVFTLSAAAGMDEPLKIKPVCFIAGTMILTSIGLTAIETIKVGDYVLAANPVTMETEEKTVVETYVNEAETLVHVVVGGEEIITTPTHPFYVENRGFMAAGKLWIGASLRDAQGNVCMVERICKEQLAEPVKVYNFQAEEYHTYHVGGLGVLVHNECPKNLTNSRPATTGENSRRLSENLAKEGRAVGEGEAAAHIVASTGTKGQWSSAADSRKLLSKYGVDINDAANGIPLGHPRPHNLTHNRAFHESVNARLHKIESDMLSIGSGRKSIRSALRRELRKIGKEFEYGIRN